jgi:hypothetical protein
VVENLITFTKVGQILSFRLANIHFQTYFIVDIMGDCAGALPLERGLVTGVGRSTFFYPNIRILIVEAGQKNDITTLIF